MEPVAREVVVGTGSSWQAALSLHQEGFSPLLCRKPAACCTTPRAARAVTPGCWEFFTEGSTVFISEKGALVNSLVILAFYLAPNKTRGKRQQITSAGVAFTLREVSLLVDLQLLTGCTGHLLTNRAKPLHSSLRALMHNMSCAKARAAQSNVSGCYPRKPYGLTLVRRL